MKTMTKIKILVALIFLCAVAFWLFLKFGGRTASRYMGPSARQVIKIPEVQAMAGNINMWYDEDNKATIKDITYCSTDGYYYSAEFRDISPFEGVIRWVPYEQGSDIIQSRKLSRWGVDVVNLKVPKNFQTMYGVSFVSKGGERVKNLTYHGKDGKVLAKEYREGIVDRFLSGYIQIKGESPIEPPPGTACDVTYQTEEQVDQPAVN